MKRMHEAGMGQMAASFAHDQQRAAAAAADERQRGLVQMAAVHEAAMKGKNEEWRGEVEMLRKHHTTSSMLTSLVSKVDDSAAHVGDLQARILTEREKGIKDRSDRVLQLEKGLDVREQTLTVRERELTHMRAQLEGVLATFETSSWESHQALVEERSRVQREHQRAEALLSTLTIERSTMQDQVANPDPNPNPNPNPKPKPEPKPKPNFNPNPNPNPHPNPNLTLTLTQTLTLT
jgi:hypothetical protein